MSALEAFRKLVSETACKVLTIKDLEWLDDVELGHKVARQEIENQIISEDEAA